MENGQSPVSERGIPGMRRMNGWVLCMSCYRRAVPTKSSTESYSLKLEGYSASLISAREYDIAGMLPQDTNYCLEFSEVEMGRKYGGIKSAFTVLILIGENEIIGREDGNWCRLEKTTDYNDMPEGKRLSDTN